MHEREDYDALQSTSKLKLCCQRGIECNLLKYIGRLVEGPRGADIFLVAELLDEQMMDDELPRLDFGQRSICNLLSICLVRTQTVQGFSNEIL
jgi:hypothetical protein